MVKAKDQPEGKEPPKRAKAAPIRAVVDRLEDGGMAVLSIGDDGKTQIDVPLSLLPEGVGDGDHLLIKITQARGARAAAVERVEKLQEQLARTSGAAEQTDFKL